ncbi:MAG TPA: hypothetical protein HA300_08270 [Thermococcaceae archaeon]|nr:hypothetical protein [Thermococcaceae archaeon]
MNEAWKESGNDKFTELLKLMESYLKSYYADYADKANELVVVFAYQDPIRDVFWGEPIDLDEVLEDTEHIAYNIALMNKRKLNVYYSILPHEKSDFEELKRKNDKTRGNRETAYKFTRKLELDIDLNINNVISHGKKIIYDEGKLHLIAKSTAHKIVNTLAELDLRPKEVYFTGGGLKVIIEFNELLDATELLRNFAKEELVTVLKHKLNSEEIKIDTAVFDEARVMRLPYTLNWSYTNKNGEQIALLVEKIYEDTNALNNFQEARRKVRAYLEEHNLGKISHQNYDEEEDFLFGDEVNEEEMRAEVLAEKFATVLRPYWIEGQRHVLSLAFAGFLRENDFDKETALQIFTNVLEIFIREGREDLKELKDRLRAFEDTYIREGNFGGPLSEKLAWDVRRIKKLEKALKKAYKLNKKYKIIAFEQLPRIIEKIVEESGTYILFFKKDTKIHNTFEFEENKLIDRKSSTYGIRYEKSVNKEFLISLESFFTRNNYLLIFPKKIIHTASGNEIEVIDTDTVLSIMYSLMEKAEHSSVMREAEHIIVAKIAVEAIKLAENVFEDKNALTSKTIAIEKLNINNKEVKILYIPSRLLLEAALKMRAVKDAKELGKLLTKAKSLKIARKLKNKKENNKTKYGFYYYSLRGDIIETLTGMELDEIIEQVKYRKQAETDEIFNELLNSLKRQQFENNENKAQIIEEQENELQVEEIVVQ